MVGVLILIILFYSLLCITLSKSSLKVNDCGSGNSLPCIQSFSLKGFVPTCNDECRDPLFRQQCRMCCDSC